MWDPLEPPSCVRAGCEDLNVKSDVTVTLQMDGAAAVFGCTLADHELVGSPALTCDGQFWNGTAPTCRKIQSSSALLNGATKRRSKSYATVAAALLTTVISFALV